MSVLFGSMVWFIHDNSFWETFIECLIHVFACTAKEKPSICAFGWVNYTDFFRGPLCLLHVSISYFIITFLSFYSFPFNHKYTVGKVYYLVQESFLLITNTERQFPTYQTSSSAVRFGWNWKKMLWKCFFMCFMWGGLVHICNCSNIITIVFWYKRFVADCKRCL